MTPEFKKQIEIRQSLLKRMDITIKFLTNINENNRKHEQN
jgi:hypothetical protein